MGWSPEIPDENFYPTIRKAVEAYREQTGADWQPANAGSQPDS